MPNNLKNSEKNAIKTSGNIQFTKINSRKKFEDNIYKKITKKDFVMALMFSFAFVFTVFSVQNGEEFKADLFDIEEEEIIYNGEKSRTFSPTLSFYPENRVIENGTRQESDKVYLDYYTLETPDSIIEISLDNITSTPTCSHGWKYKFQGTTRYLKLGETVNESDISIYGVNYPILSNQDGINANYVVNSTGTGITIFFDKDIKNGKYYDFALKDGITIYQDYKTLEKFTPENLEISTKGNELNLEFSNQFKTDFGRIIISENLISDLDGRINNKSSIVGKKIGDEFVIDNKKPEIEGSIIYGDNLITINFTENIFENPNKDLINNIKLTDPISEYNIEGNKLKLFLSSDSDTVPTILTGAVIDKSGNENNLN